MSSSSFCNIIIIDTNLQGTIFLCGLAFPFRRITYSQCNSRTIYTNASHSTTAFEGGIVRGSRVRLWVWLKDTLPIVELWYSLYKALHLEISHGIIWKNVTYLLHEEICHLCGFVLWLVCDCKQCLPFFFNNSSSWLHPDHGSWLILLSQITNALALAAVLWSPIPIWHRLSVI